MFLFLRKYTWNVIPTLFGKVDAGIFFFEKRCDDKLWLNCLKHILNSSLVKKMSNEMCIKCYFSFGRLGNISKINNCKYWWSQGKTNILWLWAREAGTLVLRKTLHISTHPINAVLRLIYRKLLFPWAMTALTGI